MVKAEQYLKLMQSDPHRILAFVVDMYGRKIAQEVARKVVSDDLTPDVELAKF